MADKRRKGTTTPKKTKRQLIYEIFDQGGNNLSQEIKNLGIKKTMRARYYREWRRERGLAPISSEGGAGSSQTVLSEITGGTTKENIGSIVRETPASPLAEPRQSITAGSSLPEKPPPAPDELTLQIPDDEPDDEPDDKKKEKLDSDKLAMEEGAGGLKASKKAGLGSQVLGQGIPVNVNLSLKTLTLWEIARQKHRDNGGNGDLTLGDFLDTAAEDLYRVRGKDLGLVNIRGG